MEYTKESLKDAAIDTGCEQPELGMKMLKHSSAWAQEVAELEKDKEELRELCRLKDREGSSFIEDVPVEDVDHDRIRELWAKHMKGGEG